MLLNDFYPALAGLLPRGIRCYRGRRSYFTGYCDGIMFDWDQYFEMIILSCCGWPAEYGFNGVRIFLDRQREDGFIARTVPGDGGESYFKHQVHVKPFLAQELMLLHREEDDLNWLRRDGYYEKLRKYLLYWLENMDMRRAGLSVWRESEHTGMDNMWERAGMWGEREMFCEGVDLNTYLCRECLAMARIAELLGDAADAAEFRERAARKREAIERFLWNAEDGIYYDFDAVSGVPVREKYIGAFFPMWAKLATAEQAEELVKKHFDSPGEFNRPWGVPVVAASEKYYTEGFYPGDNTKCCTWRAHVWMPVNYLVFHGLLNYGYRDRAEALAEKLEKLFRRAPFSEYYTAESGIGTGRKPFLGWTSLALFLDAELKLGFTPDSIEPDRVPDWSEMRRFIRNNVK